MKQRGFTVIELLVAIVVLVAIGVVFVTQKSSLESAFRDEKRRTAINAMYYNLEDVFYAKNKFYPKTINEKNLTAMDDALFTDPGGNKVGTNESDYRYEPLNCNMENQCKSYTLRTTLENEADFVRTSKNQ